MNKLPQEAAKKALPAGKMLPNKIAKQLPRVTPKKSKGTLKGIPLIQYKKINGKRTQIGV